MVRNLNVVLLIYRKQEPTNKEQGKLRFVPYTKLKNLLCNLWCSFLAFSSGWTRKEIWPSYICVPSIPLIQFQPFPWQLAGNHIFFLKKSSESELAQWHQNRSAVILFGRKLRRSEKAHCVQEILKQRCSPFEQTLNRCWYQIKGS